MPGGAQEGASGAGEGAGIAGGGAAGAGGHCDGAVKSAAATGWAAGEVTVWPQFGHGPETPAIWAGTVKVVLQ